VKSWFFMQRPHIAGPDMFGYAFFPKIMGFSRLSGGWRW